MKNIIVFGGGGYCASVLVPQLANEGWNITAFDTFLYGTKHFEGLKNVSLVRGDVRNIDEVKSALKGQEYVLHLSCISNDASFVLDEKLSTSVNLVSVAKPSKSVWNIIGLMVFSSLIVPL